MIIVERSYVVLLMNKDVSALKTFVSLKNEKKQISKKVTRFCVCAYDSPFHQNARIGGLSLCLVTSVPTSETARTTCPSLNAKKNIWFKCTVLIG